MVGCAGCIEYDGDIEVGFQCILNLCLLSPLPLGSPR